MLKGTFEILLLFGTVQVD